MCKPSPKSSHKPHRVLARTTSHVTPKKTTKHRTFSAPTPEQKPFIRAQSHPSFPSSTTPPPNADNGTLYKSKSSSIGQHDKVRRTSLVRYRSRIKAQKRTQSNNHPYAPPSGIVENVMINESRVIDHPDIDWKLKIIPRIYTWYMTWLLDFYSAITSHKANHSFKRWFVSCVVVTALCALLLSTILCVTIQLIAFCTFVLASAVYFVFLLALIVLISICFIVMLSFTGDKHSERVRKTSESM